MHLRVFSAVRSLQRWLKKKMLRGFAYQNESSWNWQERCVIY